MKNATALETTMTYLDRIKRARTRFDAADLILAEAALEVGRKACATRRERIAILDCAYERHLVLSRECMVGDAPCPESAHPWRLWLREWGYL